MGSTDLYNDEQDSIPRSLTNAQRADDSSTSTITMYNNRIVGVGTQFLTDVRVGDYIYMKSQNAFRKVDQVNSDTELIIDRAFDSAISGDTFDITPRCVLSEISVSVTGGSSGAIDGNAVPSGTSITYSKAHMEPSWNNKVFPIDVNATGTVILASFIY